MQIKLGDFVTGYGSGYWQLIGIKPKIATEDYQGERISYKKGQIIGQWAVLRKCFTSKMKPRIEFSYEDAAWIKPVSQEALADIEKYFGDNPEYAEKLNNTEIKLTPMITNVWLDLPEENEVDFKKKLNKLPAQYSKDEFWKIAGSFKKYHTKPPAKYLLNLFAYPWDVDRKGELLYSGYELTRG